GSRGGAEGLSVDLFVVPAEGHDPHQLGQLVRDQKRANLAHRDHRRTLDRETEGAGADRRKGHAAQLVPRGKLERAAIATGEQLVLAMRATSPDRPNGVDHVNGSQVVAAGELRLAGAAATEGRAFLAQAWPRGTVNRAVDTATTKQSRIGGVHDGVDAFKCDVAACNAQPIHVVGFWRARVTISICIFQKSFAPKP